MGEWMEHRGEMSSNLLRMWIPRKRVYGVYSIKRDLEIIQISGYNYKKTKWQNVWNHVYLWWSNVFSSIITWFIIGSGG